MLLRHQLASFEKYDLWIDKNDNGSEDGILSYRSAKSSSTKTSTSRSKRWTILLS